MKSIRKAFVAMVAAAACLLVLLLSGAEAQSPKRVRLAYAGWEVGTAIAYIGIDAGIFKKYDLEVEEVFIRDALTGGVQSLIGVNMVLGFGNPLAILQPVLEGADIVFLGSHVSTQSYGMGVGSEITAIKELKGKRVGVSGLGGRSDLVARVILRRAGLDPQKDVQIVSAGLSPQRMVALSKNLIQGAPLVPGVAEEAKKLGLRVLEVKSVPVVTGLLMTTRSFVKREEESARRFLKGYLAGIHYFLTRRSDSIAIIRKYFSGTDPSALETMYDLYAAQLKPLPGPNGEATQALIDVVTAVDERARKLKPPHLFDLRILEELQASGFIDNLYAEKTRL